MASKPVKALVLVHLSVLLLSCFIVLGYEEELVSFAPHHHAPSYPPTEAPTPHKGHHPGHHHSKGHPPIQPPVHPPSHPPIHPPSHTPIKPPSHTPIKPPSHPPIMPPSHPPSKPPSHPPTHPIPRKLVAVQGVVYCKACKYIGVDTLLGASPLLGALVRLQCNNTKHPIVLETKTDKNGYFFIMAPKSITTYGIHKCRVSIVSSPSATCSKATNLHAGLKGAILMPRMPPVPPPPHPLPFEVFSVGPFAFEPSKTLPCPR